MHNSAWFLEKNLRFFFSFEDDILGVTVFGLNIQSVTIVERQKAQLVPLRFVSTVLTQHTQNDWCLLNTVNMIWQDFKTRFSTTIALVYSERIKCVFGLNIQSVTIGAATLRVNTHWEERMIGAFSIQSQLAGFQKIF